MATVNIGNIKFTWQGAYNSSTAYAIDDVVSYNGSSYVCILASTGNLPTNTTYWNVMAQSGTDITSLAGLAQGDILYYNGTDWVRLGAGTAGQALLTNGTGANPSWGTAGNILAVEYGNLTTVVTNGASAYNWQDITNLSKTMTPASASSKFLINYRLSVGSLGNHVYSRMVCDGTAVNVNTDGGSGRLATTSTVSTKADWDMDTHGGSYLWSPNTTNAVTMKIQWCGENNSAEQYLNRGHRDNSSGLYDARATSDMWIMEIAS